MNAILPKNEDLDQVAMDAAVRIFNSVSSIQAPTISQVQTMLDLGVIKGVDRVKMCTGCEKEKYLSDFTKGKNKKDGKSARCKMCDKEYRDRNKQRAKEYSALYRKNNKENLLEKKREYYHKSKEKINEYKEKNKSIINKKKKAYRENNRDKINKYKKEYSQRENHKAYMKVYLSDYYSSRRSEHIESLKSIIEPNHDGKWIYIMQCGIYYKVGISLDPLKRVETISNRTQAKTKILYLAKANHGRTIDTEKIIHHELSSLNVPMPYPNGARKNHVSKEWFFGSLDKIIDVISQYAVISEID